MLILHHQDPTSTVYNMSSSFVLDGDLDITILEKAFQYLVSRHESLRTVFVSDRGKLWQKIEQHPDFKLEIVDLRDQDEGPELAVDIDEKEAFIQISSTRFW